MKEPIEQNAMNPSNENKNANNKTNTFNLVIGIATLLIAILGATFAYFSATARSAENDVTVKSAYVSIYYDGGTEIKASNLIPATLNVALKKYQKEVAVYNPETDGEIITDYDVYKNDVDRKCVDAKGKEVCYVYQFSIESDGAIGETTDIIASIKVNKNEFDNLSYILYEVTFKEENDKTLTDKFGFGIVDTYRIIRSNFPNTDTNPDNIDFVDEKFGKFEKPYDTTGDEGEITGTVNPVACLFGYTADASDKALDDTTRCATYNVTNKEKHIYQLVIWLEETGEEQPEQGKTFEGTVSIEVSGGFDSGEYGNGKITGQE
ncbi:MAG: hypothetical protein MR598_00680 [Erysipelotrichaceae bacterium]|nr:hypothetical protein [Erysipelotrichaceae bacterium]